MLTKQKQAWPGLCLRVLAAFLLLTGCSPSGSRALLEGTRSLDRGQPANAVRWLRVATEQMPTNALAWGYLGVAYHQQGTLTNAAQAYTQALLLRPELAEVRFSLGCLWMDLGQWTRAREQFTACTVLQGDFAMAWQRLGEAEVRLGQHSSALRSLGEALRLDPASADAWNWLGLAQVQEGKSAEAARSFEAALRLQANHGPALLNLAVLTQTRLERPAQALELYRRYLGFLPNTPNADEVKRVVAQLEAQAQTASAAAPQPSSAASPPAEPKPETASSPLTARVVVRTNPALRATPPSKPQPQPPVTAPANAVPTPVVTARVEPRPEIVPPGEPLTSPPPRTQTSRPPSPVTTPAPGAAPQAAVLTEPKPDPADDAERGFFAKMNPLNLLRKQSPEKPLTPLPPAEQRVATGSEARPSVPPADPSAPAAVAPARLEIPDASRFQRYTYRFESGVPGGDERAADRAFQAGETFRRRNRSAEAADYYRKAVEADPSHFAAQFNLGLLLLDAGDFTDAAVAFEAASRVEPGNRAARYNFALSLKAAGYPVDSANELIRLLQQDERDASVHLTLGNLYAKEFGDKARARKHYSRVLELDPNHPQAGSIRFWLVQNPL